MVMVIVIVMDEDDATCHMPLPLSWSWGNNIYRKTPRVWNRYRGWGKEQERWLVCVW